MNAGDGLHQSAVAVSQAVPVDGLHFRDIGTAVACNRNLVIAFDHAGHAGCPEEFIVQLAEGKTMNVFQCGKRGFHVRGDRCDELQQRFRVVRGDISVRQRRAKTFRMAGLCEPAAVGDAKAFLFDTAMNRCQQRELLVP